MAENPAPKRQKQDSGKSIWLITYAAASSDLDHELLHSYGILCDELYCITWRESKYALVHVPQSNRVRLSAFNKVMAKLAEEKNIRGSYIVGYESLTSNGKGESTVSEHPAFKKMVESLNKGTTIDVWIEKGNLETYRKGLLWKYREKSDPAEMTHGQLVHQVKMWAPIVREHEKLKHENASLQQALQSETNATNELMEEIIRLRAENRKLRRP